MYDDEARERLRWEQHSQQWDRTKQQRQEQAFAQHMAAQPHPLDRGVRVYPDESGPRPQPAPPGPGSPVETALYATAELTGQVERLVDELYGRLARGGVVQDVPVNVAKPSELPKPSCALVGQLLEHAAHLEALSLALQTLLQQLAL